MNVSDEGNWRLYRPTVALETNLARKGFVRLGRGAGGVDGSDLLGSVVATVALRPTDLDTLAWLSARRFWRRANVDFSRSRLAHDLFGRPPGGKERRTVAESIERLHDVRLTFRGYDARAKAMTTFSDVRLIERIERLNGSTSRIVLAQWLVHQLELSYVTYVHWTTLRKLRGLAKRLWIYLEAEDLRQRTDDKPPWLALGDRTWVTLGINYSKPAQARASIIRAARRIEEVDPDYRLAIKPNGTGYLLEIRKARAEKAVEGIHANDQRTDPWDDYEGESGSEEDQEEVGLTDHDDESGDSDQVIGLSIEEWPWTQLEPGSVLAIWETDGTATYHDQGCPELLDIGATHPSVSDIRLAPKPPDLAAWIQEQRIRSPDRCPMCFPDRLRF